MNFNNKVVIVTGASSGIGAAIAVAFAKEGANVAMVGRNETRLAAVEQKCCSHGYPPLVINADVSKDEDVKRIIESTVDKFGRLDILVNNAGFAHPGSIRDGKLIEAYDIIFGTNLRAPMYLTMLASSHLTKTKGNIINISSVGGQTGVGAPEYITYCVSKAALNHFTVGSAQELSAYGVRVNTISPGPVYTRIKENLNISYDWDTSKPLTTLNRISEPEEIADLALFLASDKAKGITGANYVCDNGWMVKFKRK